MNKFVWTELVSVNPSQDKEFYEKTFGWTSFEKEFGNNVYTIFQSEGVDVAGMIQSPKGCPIEKSTWLSYINVVNLQESLKKAQENGATKVPVQEMYIEGLGKIALVIGKNKEFIGFFEPDLKNLGG